jgi:hypothetical protein
MSLVESIQRSRADFYVGRQGAQTYRSAGMVPSMPSTDLGCKLLLPAAIVVLHCSSLRLTRFAADNSALQGGLNGTRYEQRANAHASYYNRALS